MRKTGIMMIVAIAAFFLICGRASARTHDEIVKQADEEVKKICESMRPFMTRPGNLKNIKVVDEDVINAYADDRGTVALYMGMVNFVQSADELAMVCGHEMSHLNAQHIKRSLGNTILATVVQAVVGGTAGDLAGNLIYTKQSRKHEREADRVGLEYAWNAGFDPYTAAELWEGMGTIGGSSGLDKYLSTHPVDKERVANFRVLLVRDCKDGIVKTHCDDIMADQALQKEFNDFEKK